MKYCSRHMHDCAAKVKQLGLYHQVQPERVALNATKWLCGDRDAFDPLVVLMLEINAKCQLMSIYVLPEGCPLCAANNASQKHTMADSWIEGFGRRVLEIAIANGIPRKVSA